MDRLAVARYVAGVGLLVPGFVAAHVEYWHPALGKPQMVEVATRNAREVAQKFADDSGSKLGKIQTASQGQFSIYDRDSNTPWIKNVRVVTSVTYYLK